MRDEGLEQLLRDHLSDERGLVEKPMFGGLVWFARGHLLCGARDDGVLVRLGKDNDRWALDVDGIVPMLSAGRVMAGWVRVKPEAFGNDALARKLLTAAMTFVRSLPPKAAPPERRATTAKRRSRT